MVHIGFVSTLLYSIFDIILILWESEGVVAYLMETWSRIQCDFYVTHSGYCQMFLKYIMYLLRLPIMIYSLYRWQKLTIVCGLKLDQAHYLLFEYAWKIGGSNFGFVHQMMYWCLNKSVSILNGFMHHCNKITCCVYRCNSSTY